MNFHGYRILNFAFFVINVVTLFILSEYGKNFLYINIEKVLTGSFLLWLGSFYIICLFLSIRRLHDLNLSPWFSLIYLLPIIAMPFLCYLVFAPSFPLTNKYGQAPPNDAIEKVIFWFILACILFVLGFCFLLISTMMNGAA